MVTTESRNEEEVDDELDDDVDDYDEIDSYNDYLDRVNSLRKELDKLYKARFVKMTSSSALNPGDVDKQIDVCLRMLHEQHEGMKVEMMFNSTQQSADEDS